MMRWIGFLGISFLLVLFGILLALRVMASPYPEDLMYLSAYVQRHRGMRLVARFEPGRPEIGIAVELPIRPGGRTTAYRVTPSEDWLPRARGTILGRGAGAIAVNLGVVYVPGGVDEHKARQFLRGYSIWVSGDGADQLVSFADARFETANTWYRLRQALFG